jgi:hypothetical protein
VISSVRRRNPVTGAAYAWLVHTNTLVNHFYVYCFDDDFGPFFLKLCSYFPERHEAPCNRVEVKCLHRDAVAAA